MERLVHEHLQRIMSFVVIVDVRLSFASKLDDEKEFAQESMTRMITATFRQMEIVTAHLRLP